ncbi:MAG: RHS repeat-associated core domain-containing protein [Nanoarchaeota archaeon]
MKQKFVLKDSELDIIFIPIPIQLYKYYELFKRTYCFSSVLCNNPSDNSFIVRNSSNTNVAFINTSGDLCLVSGSCNDRYNNCNAPGDNSFIVRNSTNSNVSYINSTGSLCLLGQLLENINNIDNNERNYTLTYDNNENLIQDNLQHYEYDNMNRMIRVRDKSSTGTIKEEYVYDNGGRRILKNVVGTNNQTIYYVGDSLVQIRNASGTFNTTYYYADNVLIAENSSSGKRYYHPDHLGSTNLITNSTGSITEETFYLPYGDVLSGGSESRYNYNSKEKDSTNLNYYGARYYKSAQGQFVQPDANLPNVYNPQYLNRYSYVLNNPYKYVDPTGEKVELVTRSVRRLPFFTHSYFQATPDNPGDFEDMESFQLSAYASEGLFSSKIILQYGVNTEKLGKTTEFGRVLLNAPEGKSDTDFIKNLMSEGEKVNEASIPYSKFFGGGENSNSFVRTLIENTGSSLSEGTYGDLAPWYTFSPGLGHTFNTKDYYDKHILAIQSKSINAQSYSKKPGTGETQKPGADGVIYGYGSRPK